MLEAEVSSQRAAFRTEQAALKKEIATLKLEAVAAKASSDALEKQVAAQWDSERQVPSQCTPHDFSLQAHDGSRVERETVREEHQHTPLFASSAPPSHTCPFQ